jgi:hypothetical protein
MEASFGSTLDNHGSHRGDGMATTYTEYRKRVEVIKNGILKDSGSQPDLNRLVRAGLDRQSFLEVLAAGAAEDRISRAISVLASPMRRRQRQLKSLAWQIRTVAAHAERLANSEDSNLDPWALLMPGSLRPLKRYKDPIEWCGPHLIRALRRCADRAEFQARAFGSYLRRLLPRDRWLHVKIVLDCVREETGEPFREEVARLLTDAYRAAGAARDFSSEQLRKIEKRYPAL